MVRLARPAVGAAELSAESALFLANAPRLVLRCSFAYFALGSLSAHENLDDSIILHRSFRRFAFRKFRQITIHKFHRQQPAKPCFAPTQRPSTCLGPPDLRASLTHDHVS